MSDPARDPATGRPASRNPILTAILIVAGIVLLLPGLCSLVFIVVLAGESFSDAFSEPDLIVLWIACLAISAGGVLLIRHAVRGNKVLPPPGSA